YLGDLSGGQAIGRIIAREFGLVDGVGTAFYSFENVPKPKLYKDAYRARLDALPLDDVERSRVLDEVRTVFALNGGIFAEMTTHLDAYRRP
ncbi:MAG: biliverdin-producing heme oxygenase, partial [Aeromicrobium sp.]